MPGLDGFATTEAIRQAEAGTGRHVPIVAFTAHAMRGDKERCLTHGMDGYVSKPRSTSEGHRLTVYARERHSRIEALRLSSWVPP